MSSGYDVLFRNVAASLRESDPGAAQALDRAAITVEEIVSDRAALLAERDAARDSCEKAAETFAEFAVALDLLRHPTLAEAARIAEAGTRAGLVAVPDTEKGAELVAQSPETGDVRGGGS